MCYTTLINPHFFFKKYTWVNFLQLLVAAFTIFLTKIIFIKIFVTLLDCSIFQLYVSSHLEWHILTNMVYRDQQLVYVTYIHMYAQPNFGYAYVDMLTFFPYDFCMIFILFKNLLLKIWLSVYLFVLWRDRLLTVYICF